MTEVLFQIANSMALAGWIALLASPLIPVWADRIAGTIIPLLLSVAYAGLILAFWSRAEGGFDTLTNVQRLFEMPEAALAGWLHFLAFDLFVGAWIVRKARAERMSYWLMLPCLPLTFMFGPAGYLAFSCFRLATSARKASA